MSGHIDAGSKHPRHLAAAVIVGMVLLPAFALAQSDQRILVTDAKLTLASFVQDPEMSWLQHNLGHAKAVLIAPSITKAGFIVGGAGGRAVVVARDPKTGKWVGPAFYTLATASV
jgi:lipid-binding SYLF domain-containing protein